MDTNAKIPDDDEALLAECEVHTFRSGGPGGQHQNTTESGVRLVHRPSGVRVESRSERSQHRNRRIALERLRDKLVELSTPEKPRQATRVPRREKRRRLDEKKRRSRVKKMRRPPSADSD